jgi:O-antigen/teichoic acid export membrane protein
MLRVLNNSLIGNFGASFQRFVHNFAAHGFGQVVNIVAQIVSVPAFLHYWSTPEYGEWLVITSIPSLLWTLDNGLSGLAANRMTVASGAGDWKTANSVFRSVVIIQGGLSVVILLGAAAVCALGNVSTMFGFDRQRGLAAPHAGWLMTPRQASAVLFIMIVYMLLGYCLGLLRAIYRARALEARGVAISNLGRLTDFLATIGVLVCHGHALAMALGLVASMSFWVIFGIFDARRRCPEIRLRFSRGAPVQFRLMMVDGLPVMAGTAAGAFFLQGYPLIVNAVLGPVAVVTLTAIRAASRTMLQLTGMVSNASSSEMARSYGSRDWDGYLRLLKVLAAVTVWTSLGVGVVLTVAGPWLIAKWTSGHVVVNHTIMLLFAISVACQSGWSACGSILFSTNMHHAYNYANFFLTLAGLAAADVMVRYAGFTGIPLVMMIVDLALLAIALGLLRAKLSFVQLGSLLNIFHPLFYLRKLDHLLQHARGGSAS